MELGLRCALVDPCAIDGRDLGSTGHFRVDGDRNCDCSNDDHPNAHRPRTSQHHPARRRDTQGAEPQAAVATTTAPTTMTTTTTATMAAEVEEQGGCGAAAGQSFADISTVTSSGLLVVRQTLQVVLDMEKRHHHHRLSDDVVYGGGHGGSGGFGDVIDDNDGGGSGGGGGAVVSGVVRHCLALVGMHPDEATEAIVDAALALQRPFAVLPCCVLPQLFPDRRLRLRSRSRPCGAQRWVRVKKYGAFLQYLSLIHI